MNISRTVQKSITMALLGLGVGVCAGPAYADQIGGTISSTRVFTTDSELVSNVTCTVTAAACLVFGAPGISLKLNGFSITGQGDAATGCGGSEVAGEVGIDVTGLRGAVIQGPGIVQRFRAHGIRIRAVRVLVRQVTASTNCMSGIIVTTGSSDNDIEGNISVRNGSNVNPCGGICLTGGASRNRVRANHLSGNGYAAQGNNFGIGLINLGGAPNDNVIVDNSVLGNANGIVLDAGVERNVIVRNLIVGNPPVQTSVNNPGTVGADIRNLSTPGSNTIEGNVCLTPVNAVCVSEVAARGR